MAAQKRKKKNCQQNFFAFLNNYQTKTKLIKIHNSQKTGDSRELFLPENDFQTCSAVNSPKQYSHEIQA